MELNFVRNFREKQRSKLAAETAPTVASEMRDHLDANGDREFRIGIAAPGHRQIDTDRELTSTIGQRALSEDLLPPRYRNRLVFNAAATNELNMQTVRFGEFDENWRFEPAENLKLVFNTPAELAMQRTIELAEQTS